MIAAADRARRLDAGRSVEYQAAAAYAEMAAVRAARTTDPIERALLAGVASGWTLKALAATLGLAYRTTRRIVKRAMS